MNYRLLIVGFILLSGCSHTENRTDKEIEEVELVGVPERESELRQEAAEKEEQQRLRDEEARSREEAERLEDAERNRRAAEDEPEISSLNTQEEEAVEGQIDRPNDGEITAAEKNLPPADRSIFFHYDQYNIRSEFVQIIETHAQFLMTNRGVTIQIQGNCDVRGSREYNVALGQRRAESVKRAMVLIGVDKSQIETVSFGAEKPDCLIEAQSDEVSCHAANRRSDIYYPDLEN